jgi:RNA polymerase sigma-70 factor (ECF subfamily)
MDDTERQLQFTSHFAECERALRAFAYSLVPNREDAKDIIQETLKELWRNFDKYDPSRPFLPWANRFVYLQTMRHRRSTAIRLKYTFSDETIRRLVDQQPSLERDSALSDALDKCLKRLSEDNRDLVRLRYYADETLQEVARRTGKSADALYKRIQRIREALHDCVTKRMACEGW